MFAYVLSDVGWLELEELCEIVIFFHLPVYRSEFDFISNIELGEKKGGGELF